ncbi:hypothetical protein [Pararhizobium sp. IMCC21322]|uniref:hypothetical protein n=1 Tax=Pararhizobium sp. IMCC21322 TaxID=3067903 RepID=UPI002741D891|nr:hypothetical protein [Pararhizobium sp. IMCC21322]
MSKANWFQISLLAIWGVSAVAALSGSFWLARADWVQAYRADANAVRAQQSALENPIEAALLQEELLVLREAVTRLDRQNRILMSRLESVEDESGEFTAAIPSSPGQQRRMVGVQSSQRMPAPLSNTLIQKKEIQSESRVLTRTDPYPLKMQGTGRAPTDAEISEALKGQ